MSEQPPTRVDRCPTCGHDREVVTGDEGTSYFKPPSEQPREGTRGDLAERLEGLAALMGANLNYRCGSEAGKQNAILLREAASALRTSTEQGAARVEGLRLTHGRHCPCSACALQDWSDPALAACGMHGPSCPPRYAPYHGVKLGDPAPTPTPGEDARVAELDVITVRATVIEAYDDGSATLEIGAKGEVVNLDAEQLAFTRTTTEGEDA